MFWEFSVDILSLIAVLITYLFKVLKPLSAECHVVMDQSSEIVLDTPKVFEKVCKFLFLKSSLLVENHYSLFFKIFFSLQLLIEVLQQELSLVFTQTQVNIKPKRSEELLFVKCSAHVFSSFFFFYLNSYLYVLVIVSQRDGFDWIIWVNDHKPTLLKISTNITSEERSSCMVNSSFWV